MLLLVVCAFLPATASAQDCDQTVIRIYQLASTEARQVSDSLQTILDLVAFVRDCKEKPSRQLEIWLLHNEVLALEALGRNAEAIAKVNRFFEAYFEDATDRYRARFYLWRLHLNALAGNVLDMVVDYNEAQEYAYALDTTHRAHLYINGAHAYAQINEPEKALQLTQEAKALIGEPKTYEDSLAMARAAIIGAEAQLRLGTDLPEVEEKLRAAGALYGALGDTARVALASTLLGMTYAAQGDTTAALAEMATGVVLAQRAGTLRSRVYTHYRQGQLLLDAGDLAAAEQSLQQALDASETFREFYIPVVYELARLYERREEYKKATRYYQTVVDAPKPERLVEELETERKARDGLIRILLIEKERSRNRFHLALVALLLVAGAGLLLFWRWRKRPAASVTDRLEGALVIPENLPTGDTLADLERRFRQAVDSELLGSRLARLYAVLFDPDLVLVHIKDAVLAKQIKASRVENNTALFLCAAAVEEGVEGRSFRNNPANTLGAYLRSEFRKRKWGWPKNPLAWKRYFWDHHVPLLFEKDA